MATRSTRRHQATNARREGGTSSQIQGRSELPVTGAAIYSATVASELAAWQSMHDQTGKHVIREYVRGMVVLERNKLDGMMRALRKVRGLAEEGREREWGPLPSAGLKVQDREMADVEQSPTEEVSGGGEVK